MRWSVCIYKFQRGQGLVVTAWCGFKTIPHTTFRRDRRQSITVRFGSALSAPVGIRVRWMFTSLFLAMRCDLRPIARPNSHGATLPGNRMPESHNSHSRRRRRPDVPMIQFNIGLNVGYDKHVRFSRSFSHGFDQRSSADIAFASRAPCKRFQNVIRHAGIAPVTRSRMLLNGISAPFFHCRTRRSRSASPPHGGSPLDENYVLLFRCWVEEIEKFWSHCADSITPDVGYYWRHGSQRSRDYKRRARAYKYRRDVDSDCGGSELHDRVTGHLARSRVDHACGDVGVSLGHNSDSILVRDGNTSYLLGLPVFVSEGSPQPNHVARLGVTLWSLRVELKSAQVEKRRWKCRLILRSARHHR
jgi:hypothetical protein